MLSFFVIEVLFFALFFLFVFYATVIRRDWWNARDEKWGDDADEEV